VEVLCEERRWQERFYTETLSTLPQKGRIQKRFRYWCENHGRYSSHRLKHNIVGHTKNVQFELHNLEYHGMCQDVIVLHLRHASYEDHDLHDLKFNGFPPITQIYVSNNIDLLT
jgi:hypothetical protein